MVYVWNAHVCSLLFALGFFWRCCLFILRLSLKVSKSMGMRKINQVNKGHLDVPPLHQSILIQMHNNPMPWFLHINLGFKCYINLSLRRSFTFYNDLIYNKIRWCKICPNLLWVMRPNVVALVGHMSGLRFSCTFSFIFCLDISNC
jgi:hypothetical protein